MIRWGIVATVKAPAEAVLDFAAYHLDLGADRLCLYLDAPDATLAARLRTQPAIRVVETGADYWARTRRRGRPARHQMRQQHNAQHAYRRAGGLDWLAHIDVDEFLCPRRPVPELLAEVPSRATTARVAPIEALAGDETLWKALPEGAAARRRAAARLYPTFGAALPGGFLSHVVGKAFVRTRLDTGPDGVRLRLHGIRHRGALNPDDWPLAGIDLAHRHADSWERFRAHLDYRLRHGSYRAALAGPAAGDRHRLLSGLLAERGEDGLRQFFREVAEATPEHVAALAAEGLLRRHDLALPARRARRFPEGGPSPRRRGAAFDSEVDKPLQGARMLRHDPTWAAKAASPSTRGPE